jgi:hypothetical protein
VVEERPKIKGLLIFLSFGTSTHLLDKGEEEKDTGGGSFQGSSRSSTLLVSGLALKTSPRLWPRVVGKFSLVQTKVKRLRSSWCQLSNFFSGMAYWVVLRPARSAWWILNATESPSLPVKKKPLYTWTAVGLKALRRAKLEAERRFCDSDSEKPTGESVVLELRDKLKMLLDPRTVGCLVIGPRGGNDAGTSPTAQGSAWSASKSPKLSICALPCVCANSRPRRRRACGLMGIVSEPNDSSWD